MIKVFETLNGENRLYEAASLTKEVPGTRVAKKSPLFYVKSPRSALFSRPTILLTKHTANETKGGASGNLRDSHSTHRHRALPTTLAMCLARYTKVLSSVCFVSPYTTFGYYPKNYIIQETDVEICLEESLKLKSTKFKATLRDFTRNKTVSGTCK